MKGSPWSSVILRLPGSVFLLYTPWRWVACEALTYKTAVKANLSVVLAFDVWAADKGIAKSFDLKFLQDRVIGIDATYYIDGLNNDPLLSALGGSPLAFEKTVIDVVTHLHNAGLKLHFVFNGLDSGVGNDPMASSVKAAQLDNEAFTLYEAQQAKKARDVFKESGTL